MHRALNWGPHFTLFSMELVIPLTTSLKLASAQVWYTSVGLSGPDTSIIGKGLASPESFFPSFTWRSRRA